jgi:hypothetical protein
MSDEEGEQRQLLVREIDALAVEPHLVRREVERERPELDLLVVRERALSLLRRRMRT